MKTRIDRNGQPVSGKQIETKVNGTVKAVATTQSNSSYSVVLDLVAADNNATLYQIEAEYGDNSLNLTGLATLPNGTSYAVCTTLHYYGHKPSANTTMLRAESQTMISDLK